MHLNWNPLGFLSELYANATRHHLFRYGLVLFILGLFERIAIHVCICRHPYSVHWFLDFRATLRVRSSRLPTSPLWDAHTCHETLRGRGLLESRALRDSYYMGKPFCVDARAANEFKGILVTRINEFCLAPKMSVWFYTLLVPDHDLSLAHHPLGPEGSCHGLFLEFHNLCLHVGLIRTNLVRILRGSWLILLSAKRFFLNPRPGIQIPGILPNAKTWDSKRADVVNWPSYKKSVIWTRPKAQTGVRTKGGQ